MHEFGIMHGPVDHGLALRSLDLMLAIHCRKVRGVGVINLGQIFVFLAWSKRQFGVSIKFGHGPTEQLIPLCGLIDGVDLICSALKRPKGAKI